MTGRVPLVVVGNPENRRVTLFRAAATEAGVPVVVLPWRRLATGPVWLPRAAVVRIDSPGEDAEVDRLLRGADRPAEHGEIVGLAAWYAGFRAALGRLGEAARSAGATLLNDPDDVLAMFDKRTCHARLTAARVPVPPALRTAPSAPPTASPGLTGSPGPTVPSASPSPSTSVGSAGQAGSTGGYPELRAAMRAAGWSRVFVKPAHGSSASGVLALQVAPGRIRATTSVELTAGGKLYNSLRVRDYTDERQIAAIVDRLAPDGLHVERWFPKAGLGDRTIDLRVLVVAGRPEHVVVRASPGPLTNLHLGNARADLSALRAAMGESAYAAALQNCVRAAACFPGSLHVGVDLLIGTGWQRHAVAEVNAFGDLLPGLSDPAGRDSYAAELHALRTGRFDRWRATAPTLLESTLLESTLLESTLLESTLLESTLLGPTMLESTAEPEPTTGTGTTAEPASTARLESAAGADGWGPRRAGDGGIGQHENPGRDRKVGRAA
ncbi:STM4014 family protein [Plantactinospora sp. KLBMP9567]|uniref:STM4014 family protein n=1 Tax=Plantactinospora sp. KLBMP9567 TaxID=3085900 RepID=UPI0029811F9B|nr:STM4014 family protein [Plantactinospora sp. KLBMP9567]MDW5323234.1 STM4014 family protein [Plantactinospora sp. KLBMP9567]